MSQVRFYSMKLDFKHILQLYNAHQQADFAYLVFQNEIEDSNRNRDEYILIAYRVGNDWSVKQRIDAQYLTADYTDDYRHQGKLYFSNYPLSRARIAAFINLDPQGVLIDHLYLQPEQYPSHRKYARYQITPVYASAVLKLASNADTALNPSPPADPS